MYTRAVLAATTPAQRRAEAAPPRRRARHRRRRRPASAPSRAPRAHAPARAEAARPRRALARDVPARPLPRGSPARALRRADRARGPDPRARRPARLGPAAPGRPADRPLRVRRAAALGLALLRELRPAAVAEAAGARGDATAPTPLPALRRGGRSRNQEYCLECGARLATGAGRPGRPRLGGLASGTAGRRRGSSRRSSALVIAVLGTGAAIAISGDGEQERRSRRRPAAA